MYYICVIYTLYYNIYIYTIYILLYIYTIYIHTIYYLLYIYTIYTKTWWYCNINQHCHHGDTRSSERRVIMTRSARPFLRGICSSEGVLWSWGYGRIICRTWTSFDYGKLCVYIIWKNLIYVRMDI